MLICLTWTITPSKKIQNLKFRDPEKRLEEYVNNILFLIIFSHFDKIIFCENSNYSWEIFHTIHEIALIFWKNFEYISFEWNHLLSEIKWRWYGEQEILEYFIVNSKLLKNENSFYKLTGRYKIVNINEIIKKNWDNENIFTKISPWDTRCSTAFFRSSKLFFEKVIMNSGDEVDDTMWDDFQLEWIYKKRLQKYRNEFISTRVLPIFEANTWSGYLLRKNLIRDFIKKLLNYLWLYNL